MGRTKEQKLMIAKAFCYDNKLTLEQMDRIWEFMLDKNWKVAKLTDEGLDWTDLNPVAMTSLLDLYHQALEKGKLNDALLHGQLQCTLKPGDLVVMAGCPEARTYEGEVWTAASDPWIEDGSEVIRLKDYKGGFLVDHLLKIEC